MVVVIVIVLFKNPKPSHFMHACFCLTHERVGFVVLLMKLVSIKT